MRRLLLLATTAAAAVAISAAPAQAQYLVNGCSDGDWTVAEVTVAGSEIVQVCTDRPPILISCDICSKISI